MEKKKYIKPELEIVEISHSAPLLDCSGENCDFQDEVGYIGTSDDTSRA